MLARYLFGMATHRGGEIRAVGRVLHVGAALTMSVDPGWWDWKDVISCHWKLKDEHINVLESRAYSLAIRWRLRNRRNVGSRFFHLVDSLVTLSVMAKGRSSSHRLAKVICRANANILAGHLYPTLGYVRSHRNPSDGGSWKVRKPAFQKSTKRWGLVPTET